MNASQALWTELWDQARALGPDPQLEDLSDEQVEAEVRRGAAQIAALTCRWLLHVTELVVRGIWADDGQPTPGVWLSWRVGVAPATAREYVRVGLALRTAPRVRERFAAGTLSYSKVRAITRVVAPETEQQLLDLADAAPAAQLERIIAGCRRQLSDQERWADGPPPPVADPRDVQRIQRDPDTVEYRIRLATADAAAFDARLERLVDLADRDDTDQPALTIVPGDSDDSDGAAEGGDTYLPIGARRAQAICDALATAVADGPPDRSGDDDHLVVLHVDIADMIAATTDGAEVRETAASAEAADGSRTPARPPRQHVVTGRGRGMSLPRSVVARLACEADVRLAAVDRRPPRTPGRHRSPVPQGPAGPPSCPAAARPSLPIPGM